jgi:hypothetical protein
MQYYAECIFALEDAYSAVTVKKAPLRPGQFWTDLNCIPNNTLQFLLAQLSAGKVSLEFSPNAKLFLQAFFKQHSPFPV